MVGKVVARYKVHLDDMELKDRESQGMEFLRLNEHKQPLDPNPEKSPSGIKHKTNPADSVPALLRIRSALMSVFVLSIADCLLRWVKLSEDKVLDSQEQILCVEIASFVTVALKAMPNATFQKDDIVAIAAHKPPMVQEDVSRKVLEWMVQPPIIGFSLP